MYINLIFIIVVKPVRWSGFKLVAINAKENNGLKPSIHDPICYAGVPGLADDELCMAPYGPYRTGFDVPRLFHSDYKNAPTEGRRMSVTQMSHRGWTSVRKRPQPNLLVSDDGSHGVLNFILCAVVLPVFCDSLCIYIYYFKNTRCSSTSLRPIFNVQDRAVDFSIHD